MGDVVSLKDYQNKYPSSTHGPGLHKTIDMMAQIANGEAGKKHVGLRMLAEDIIQGVNARDYLSEALAIYHWFCRNIRYTRDIKNVETLKTPAVLLERRQGDCDDMAAGIAAMCMAIGMTCRFRAVDFTGRAPPLYSHVFCEVRNPSTGDWITLDPVAGPRTTKMLAQVKASLVRNL